MCFSGDFFEGSAFKDFMFNKPKWVRDHPEEVAAAALLAATIYTGGAAAGAWGGAAAGGAAAGGLGAAEAGAGAAAAAGSGLTAADYAAVAAAGAGAAGGAGAAAELGSGLTAADYAGAAGLLGEAGAGGAAEFGSGLAAADYAGAGMGAGEYGGLLGSSGSSAMDIGSSLGYGGELSSVADSGGAWLGTAPQDVTVLPGDWSGPLQVWEKIKGIDVQKGLKGLNAAQQYSRLAQPAPAPRLAATRPPQQVQSTGDQMAALQAFYSNPAGNERLKQLLRQRGVQV